MVRGFRLSGLLHLFGWYIMHFQYQIWHWIEQSTFHTLAGDCWVFCTMPSLIMCLKYNCITVSQMLVIVFACHHILPLGIHFSIAINLHPIINKSMVVLNKSGISYTGSTSLCPMLCLMRICLFMTLYFFLWITLLSHFFSMWCMSWNWQTC